MSEAKENPIVLCPKCGASISVLRMFFDTEAFGVTVLHNEKVQSHTQGYNDEEVVENLRFQCPECREELGLKDENQAGAFLKGTFTIPEPHCPKCNKNIDKLYYSYESLESGKLYITGDELEYYQKGSEMTGNFKAECPHCEENIAENEEDAEAILKGVYMQ